NPPEYTGNFLLFDLLGADSVTVSGNGSDLLGEAETRATELRAEGKTPYVIPVGGSNAIGALGYVDCGGELLVQVEDARLDVTAIVPRCGSAGLQADLIVGLRAAGSDIPVLGINVSRSCADQEPKVVDIVDSTGTSLNLPPVPRDRTVAL